MFNTIFATLILGEPFTRYSFAGTLLVCIGAVLIATFGAVGEPAHTLNQLLKLLQRRPFLLWMGSTAVLAALILIGSKVLKYCLLGSRGKPVAGQFVLHTQRLQSRVKLFRGMCYGSVSGILSAHSLLLAKSAVELLVRTVVDRANQFNRWQSWVILLAMIFLALSQLFYLHRGLKLCSTSVLYPFVFCVYNIIAILDGLIYFRQASQLAGLHAGLIALGTFVLLGGVLCLSWRLEDIDSHAAITVVGPTQTGLGPGMAVVEEQPSGSVGLLDGTGDEESQLGECEPLLQGAARFRRLPSFQRARAPSLPFLPPVDSPEAADFNAASIWAELDDSDYDFADPKIRSSIERPRSSSSNAALNGPLHGLTRHSTVGPIPYQRTRGSRRPPSVRTGGWRRSSAPLAGLMDSPRNRRHPWRVSSGVHGVNGYGTIREDEGDQPAQDNVETPHTQGTVTGLLAGPRRALTGAWRQGQRFLSRWTSPRAGSQFESSREEPSSPPLLPRSGARFLWPRDIQEHSNTRRGDEPSSL